MRRIALIVSLALLPAGAYAQEPAGDAVPGFPFKEGDNVSFDQIEKLKDFLPPEFWENREYFFYEGMQIEIGPTFRQYGIGADAFVEKTEKYKGQSAIGKDGSLDNYKAGLPFPDKIDCKGDPQAGNKIIYNFTKEWKGAGGATTWSYTYWDRGEQLPLYYRGNARSVVLSYRPEPQYDATDHSLFQKDQRWYVQGFEVDAPFDARGIIGLWYRYKASDYPLDKLKDEDFWVYVPDLRRVRRISAAQRTDSVAGTDFMIDDLRSFDGLPPQYEWSCIGEATVLAPMNTKDLAYPYREDYNYGPYGYSFANDRWELRKAYVLRFDPRNDDHPYHHKDIYVDQETFLALYSFAYDRKKELWKIIWHNHRFSEDWVGKDPKAPGGNYYPGWEGVDKPKDIMIVADIIVNVQTGTGNRIEFWDHNGTPLPSKGKIRAYIDLGRLNKGR